MDLQKIKKQIRQNKYLNPVVTAVGLLFIFLGFLGFLLPVVPGIVFLVIGIAILGEEFFLTKWIIKKSPEKVKKKLQKIHSKDKME